MSKEIQFLKQIFTFSNAPDDFSLSADERATRDFEKDCKFFFYFSFLYLVKKYDMDSPSSELN